MSTEDLDELTKMIKSKAFPELSLNESHGVGIKKDDKLSVVKQKQYEIDQSRVKTAHIK